MALLKFFREVGSFTLDYILLYKVCKNSMIYHCNNLFDFHQISVCNSITPVSITNTQSSFLKLTNIDLKILIL